MSYFALLSFSQTYWQLLISYVCLAVGSTLIGNMLYNITQTEIAAEDQPNIFLLQDVFTNVSSALMVLLLGWGQNIGYSLRPLYQLFFLVALIIVPFLCYRRPKKRAVV
ncbi:MAG: hypothetical protein LKE89_04935 [Lactobacillaceae bacterium]|nr:hypothetical protein [Lactobacillaceae bacterium]